MSRPHLLAIGLIASQGLGCSKAPPTPATADPWDGLAALSISATGPVESIRLTEELRVGSNEMQGGVAIGQIGAFSDLPLGRFVYWDRQFLELRFYAADGSLELVGGRAGEGPGEFRDVFGIGMIDGNRLAVWDPGNTRVSILDLSGRVLEDFRVNSGVHNGTGFAIASDTSFTVLSTAGSKPCGRSMACSQPMQLLVYGIGGHLIRTIPLPLSERDRTSFAIGQYRNFPVETIYDIGRGGVLAVGRNDSYAITFGSAEAPIRVSRTWDPVRLAPEEKTQWEFFLNGFERRTGEKFPVPDAKPAYRRFTLDDDGRLWVERYVAAVQENNRCLGSAATSFICWVEPVTLDLFGVGGEYLGTATLPAYATFKTAHDSTLWHTEVLEDGRQELVRSTLTFPSLEATQGSDGV